MKRRLFVLAAAMSLLAGCATAGYYAQAIGGHLRVMREARSLEAHLADPSTPAPLRDRLARVRTMRQFAVDELALPDNGSYRSYADLGRAFVLWNVFAAPEFSVRPVESCFPFAGCVAYRGWYDEADARRHADGLKAQGHDVYVAGVPAYSTLGWFDDPLLNTFMAYPEPEVARLIFHELAHQVAYVSNDTVFNESFAVAVEEEGLRRWMAVHADPAAKAGYQAARQRRGQFIALMQDYRARLERFYAQQHAEGERRAGKAALFGELAADYRRLKQSWGGFSGYDRLFAQGANNALLASIAAYNAKLPAFRALLARERGDLPSFYSAVRQLAGLPVRERDALLNTLANAVP